MLSEEAAPEEGSGGSSTATATEFLVIAFRPVLKPTKLLNLLHLKKRTMKNRTMVDYKTKNKETRMRRFKVLERDREKRKGRPSLPLSFSVFQIKSFTDKLISLLPPGPGLELVRDLAEAVGRLAVGGLGELLGLLMG